jgi:hypothetical protein
MTYHNTVLSFIYIFSFIVVMIIVSKALSKSKEFFSPSLTIVVDEKSDSLTVMYPESIFSKDISSLGSLIKNVTIKKVPTLSLTRRELKQEQAICIDAFSWSVQSKKENINDFSFLTGTNTERVAYFIRSLEIPTKSFTDDNVVIGYTNDIDILFIKQVMTSYKDIAPSYTLKAIDIPDQYNVIDKSVFSNNKIDTLFIFETLESPVMTKKIDANMKLEVWDYADNVDIHKIKVLSPFIRRKNIDFSIHFPQIRGKLDIVSGVFVFDNIIVINEKMLDEQNLSLELKNIVQLYNKPDLINFYEQYFKVTTVSKDFARTKNDFYTKRDTMQILEQFKDVDGIDTKDFIFDINQNVNGFYETHTHSFFVYSNMINGIPLQKNNFIKFSQQIREDQNGIYKVESVTNKQSILIRLNPLEEHDKTNNTRSEPGYLCYNHQDITSKAACESPFDEMGNTKRNVTYWDKPCEKHTDCPFYQSNKNYQNYRGGCIDGRCEMPLGVKNVAYRLYDKAQKPLCHNCESDEPFCCEEQKDKNKYSQLKGPDYAFEIDEFERK